MSIAQLHLMSPHVRKFMEGFQQLQLKINLRYANESAPEMMRLWPRVVQNNKKIINREADIAELWNTFTRDEMLIMAKAQDAGVNATLQTWDGMIHVCQLYMLGELPEAREAIDRIGEWVQNLFE